MKKNQNKYKVKFYVELVDLSNPYNKAVHTVSNMMNEIMELRPYIKTKGFICLETEKEPNKEQVLELEKTLKKSLKEEKKDFILLNLYFKNVELDL